MHKASQGNAYMVTNDRCCPERIVRTPIFCGLTNNNYFCKLIISIKEGYE